MSQHSEQERAAALSNILDSVAVLGLEAAVAKFGFVLSNEEREILETMSSDELLTLKAIEAKLGPLAQLRLATNNNNNRNLMGSKLS